jgi:hypothetical protein
MGSREGLLGKFSEAHLIIFSTNILIWGMRLLLVSLHTLSGS